MAAMAQLKLDGHVEEGDVVMFTCGDSMETVGGTNTCKVLTVK